MGWPWSKKKPDDSPKSLGERIDEAQKKAMGDLERQVGKTRKILDQMNTPRNPQSQEKK
jgi:hypothetical protein